MTLGPWAESCAASTCCRCGDKIEWRHTHDYWEDKHTIPHADLEDGTLRFD